MAPEIPLRQVTAPAFLGAECLPASSEQPSLLDAKGSTEHEDDALLCIRMGLAVHHPGRHEKLVTHIIGGGPAEQS